MKTALSAIALVAALTLAPFVGGSFAVADDSAARATAKSFHPGGSSGLSRRTHRRVEGRPRPERRPGEELAAARNRDARSRQAKSRARRRLERATRRQSGRGRRGQSDRSPRPHVRAVERARSRPAETGHRREAPLRQPGRQPEAPVRCAVSWVHGPWPRAALAPRGLSAARIPPLPQRPAIWRPTSPLDRWRRAAVYVTIEDLPAGRRRKPWRRVK